MRVKIWGSRGSLPAPLEPENVEALIRNSIQDFLRRGFTRENEIESFCAQLPRHLLGGYGGNTPCIEI
ncbi:MAG: MBL fold metallo-hydrolase, partial [Bdellovibrionia bacterium]